jgi:hypothetical protein
MIVYILMERNNIAYRWYVVVVVCGCGFILNNYFIQLSFTTYTHLSLSGDGDALELLVHVNNTNNQATRLIETSNAIVITLPSGMDPKHVENVLMVRLCLEYIYCFIIYCTFTEMVRLCMDKCASSTSIAYIPTTAATTTIHVIIINECNVQL